ncbi:hypothetical protein QOZ80_4AG0327320 [Eleusine coracana subsp. coracana]|nr:hypothetical protein QOZ80_4AG0327320 [Eleusine coracana subsp. coracana]
MAAGGQRRWQDNLEPNARHIVCQHMVRQLSELFEADPSATPEKLRSYAAYVEEGAFRTAQSQADYLRRIAMRLQSLAQDRQRAKQAAAENRKQQMQIAHQTQLGNPVQAIQGGNSLFTTTPQAASVMASPIRPPSQQPNWHMPAGPNIQIRPSNMMAMVTQNFNSQSAAFAPVAPGVQSGQQVVQSRPMQSQSKRQEMQLQHTSFGSCNQASVAQLRGQPVVRPNAQQPDQLLNQNVSGIYGVQQQPMHFVRNHQGLRVNQHHTNSQWYQMVGANNVAKLNSGYPGGLNSQQNVGCTAGEQSSFKACGQEMLKQQNNMESQSITVNQQGNNVYCPNPAPETTNHDEAVDWREDMFQQIKLWKSKHFSDIMELNRMLVIPKITEEQLQSLPKCKAEAYKHNLFVKNMITCVLKFLQLQKSEIPETYSEKLRTYQIAIEKLINHHRKIKARIKGSNIGQGSQDHHGNPQTIDLTGETAPFNGTKRSQKNQRKQPADASICQTRQNFVTITPPAHPKTDSRDLQGVGSPCFSVKSPGELLSSPTNDVGVCCTPSSIARSGVVQVASPYSSPNSTMQSPIAKPGAVVAASPCASLKSSLTSTNDKSKILATASPCSTVKSTLLSNAAKSGVVPVTSPCDSVKSTAPDDINNQVTAPQLIVPASLCVAQTADSQAEGEVCVIAKTPLAKKPIDRLLDAVRASSPSVLHSSVNSIKSALIAMDSVPLPPLSGSNNKMKRSYDVTSSNSESSPLGNISGATYVWEHGAKRQKTQDAKEALLDEVKATNNILIDTTISILGANSADGITSCNCGTLIKLLHTRVSLAPDLKSHLLTLGMQPLVMPVTLLVPADYPASSPTIICDEGGEMLRKKSSNISEAVDAAFRHALRVLPEPRSLKETASAWEACVRRGITDFVQLHAGGALGSRLGQWESCVGA